MMIRHLLRRSSTFCSSKKITPPEPIPFEFNVPQSKSDAQRSDKKATNNVKTVRAKRVDVSKILKKKKSGETYKMKIEEQYLKDYEQNMKNNFKTSNYHYDQYLKGEHLLENIPLDPYYAYKIADYKRKVQGQKQKFKDFVSPMINHDERAQLRQKMTEAYHQKQQKYELQEYAKYLDNYPGSPQGPLPEDDMQHYMQYANQRVPQILADQISFNMSAKNKEKDQAQNVIENGGSIRIHSDGHYSDIMSGSRQISDEMANKQLTPEQVFDQIVDLPIYNGYEQIPQTPEVQFKSYQSWMKDMAGWRNFKNYYTAKNGQSDLDKYCDYLHQVAVENDPEPENQWHQLEPKATSLTRYFQTLPMWLQEHSTIKDIYLGLEFYSPDLTVEQKEDTLNLAAKMAQPLDRVSKDVIKELIEKKKYYMTPFICEKIKTINPEFTWDIKDFFAEIKREQLKGTSMIKENEETFPQPPQKHLEYEDHGAKLPVTFYDNDDGFWDEIISEKLKRYDEVKPIMKWRKHFTH